MNNDIVDRLKNAKHTDNVRDSFIYNNGIPVFCLASCRSKTIEEWIRILRERSNQKIDWYYAGGRAIILTTGNLGLVQKAIEDTLLDLKYFYENIEGPIELPSLDDLGHHLSASYYDSELGLISALVDDDELIRSLEKIEVSPIMDLFKGLSDFERGKIYNWALSVSLFKDNEYQKIPPTPESIISFTKHLNIPKEGFQKIRTFEEEISKTEYLVNATDNETMCLWQQWALEAKRLNETFEEREYGRKRYVWIQHNPGMVREIGKLDGRPVVICIFWNTINDHFIGFWDLISQVCDYKMAEDWLDKTFKNVERTNAMNFHNIERLLMKS